MGRGLFLLVSGLISLWNMYKEWRDQVRCPQCGKYWAAEELGEERMGIFRKHEPSLFDTGIPGTRSTSMVPYEKYKVHCKCAYCSHRWEFSRSRKL
jgi:hypothetical protein